MTKPEIDAIRAAYRAYYIELPDKQYKERDDVEKVYTDLAAVCDHTYPDGSNAILTHLDNACGICNRTQPTGEVKRDAIIEY